MRWKYYATNLKPKSICGMHTALRCASSSLAVALFYLLKRKE
uniref:Uncharacterized protein n=1 Tax=Siphoviridae sp. ctXZx16 TaxID=2826371 RepID=A0A8S5MLU4_9CAUD|nr:MAG TPA: hypothetical protein [Siphoviridae sp. ctXZx16]